MGMGYGGNYADVIAFDDVKSLCPVEVDALESTLKKYKVSVENLAETFKWEEPELETLATALSDAAPADLDNDAYARYEEEAINAITLALKTLQEAFAQATAVGDSHLNLSIGYHCTEDEGDRYDDVDGVFWAVDGLYQLTPAGKKFGNKVERKFFVTFG